MHNPIATFQESNHKLKQQRRQGSDRSKVEGEDYQVLDLAKDLGEPKVWILDIINKLIIFAAYPNVGRNCQASSDNQNYNQSVETLRL